MSELSVDIRLRAESFMLEMKFSAPPGIPTVTALRLSQRQLMDDPNTSHPFYWSAFAAVGDGEIPVIRTKQVIAAAH